MSSALLAALRPTCTAHLFADTADGEELRPLLAVVGGGILAEVDGNTVNQPLAPRVVERYLAGDRLVACAQELRCHRPGVSDAALLPYLYTMVSGWIGDDVANAFAAGHPWEVSLQLHMGALSERPRDREGARARTPGHRPLLLRQGPVPAARAAVAPDRPRPRGRGNPGELHLDVLGAAGWP